MTATKNLRKHPKPPTRSALARPTGSASEAFDKWDGRPPTSGYGYDMLAEEYDRADRKRAFLAGARWQRRMMANGELSGGVRRRSLQ